MEKLVLIIALSIGSLFGVVRSEDKEEDTVNELISLTDTKFDTTNKGTIFEIKI